MSGLVGMIVEYQAICIEKKLFLIDNVRPAIDASVSSLTRTIMIQFLAMPPSNRAISCVSLVAVF